MSGPNNTEGGEWNINMKKNTQNEYSRLIKDFSREKLKDQTNRSRYVHDLRKAWNVSSTLLQEIEKFAGKNEDYDGLEITRDKINYHALVRETGAFFTTLSNNKRTVKDLYLQDYEITEESLSQLIDTSLDSLTEKQIEDLIKSEKNRKMFLQKQMWKSSLPVEKTIISFLKDFNLDERYKNLPEEQKSDFRYIVNKIRTGQKIDDIDLEILFDSQAYTEKEKEKLLNKLVPSISLQQALDYQIITQGQANDFKTQRIREADDSLWDDDIREIVAQINDKEVKIATSQFTSHKGNREALITHSEIFEDFVRRYNKNIEEIHEKIHEWDLRKLSDFQEALTNNPKVFGSENLKVGSVFQIKQTQKNTDGGVKNIVLYGKIKSLWDEGVIEIIEKSHDSKYDDSNSTVIKQKYSEFLSYISHGNQNRWINLEKVTILSESQLHAKILSWEIEEYNGDSLKLKSKESIEADIAAMTRDINTLKEDLRKKEQQLRNNLAWKGLSSDEIQEKIDADPWVQKYREQIEEKEAQQSEKSNTLENLDTNHYETLKKQINEIDSSGEKFWLDKKTTFKTKEGNIYTITDINKASWEITLSSLLPTPETYSFEDFYRGFKTQNTKRVNIAAENFEELMWRIGNGDFPEAWKKFSFKNGRIQKKESKKKIEYDYLVSNNSSELLKIHDISGDRVLISFGEIKTKTKKTKEGYIKRTDSGKAIQDETFTVENKEYSVSLGFLEEYIKENKLEPRGLKDKQEITADEKGIDPMKKKTHFWSLMFHNRATIADAVKWWKLFIEQMTEMLQKGSDEKASEFALKYMGWFLTADAKRDMQSRLEQKQKKSMDDYLERLKVVASDVAVKMIDQWLHDKYGPAYPKEAAVVFMLEKYGVLNAKALEKYEGKYVWYQALGGEINDEFFKTVKEEKESQDLPFTEEYLVYKFIKKQCWPKWYNGIKRRSKFHKEIKRVRAVGKDEEYEVGKTDGNDERTLEWRVNWWIGEMLSNNYPNMVGWLEVAVNKWGPMHIMNKIPFLAAFSGVAYNFEEKTTDQLKNFPASTRVLMMLRFFSHHSDLDLLNKTILAVCKTLEAKWNPRHIWIAKKAQDLFDQRRNPGDWVADKIKKTEAFYDQYGEDLTNILYMLNTGKKEDTLNKLIFFEKDNKDNPESETLKKYYDTLHAFIWADTEFKDEGLMNDPFKGAWVSGLELHKVTEQLLVMRQGHWTKHAGPSMWDEVRHEFEMIPKRRYHDDDRVNNEMQRKLLKDNLQRFLSGLLLAVGWNPRELLGYNSPTTPFSKLNTWGINMEDFMKIDGLDAHTLMHGWPKYDGLIDTYVERIIRVEQNNENFSHLISGDAIKESQEWRVANSIADSVSKKIAEGIVHDSDDGFANDPV